MIELLKDIMDIVEDSTVEVEVVTDWKVNNHSEFVTTKGKIKIIDADCLLKKLEESIEKERNE